jgi:predicted TIM-barrel fold metal-dependent hydrolase
MTMSVDTHGTIDALLVVDADTHLTEPWDLWTSRAPDRYKDRVPQVKAVDGEYHWVFDGQRVGPARAVCVVDRQQEKHLGSEYLFTKHIDEVTAAASSVPERLALMDEQGIWAHLVYPNAVGFGGQQLGNIGDLGLRHAVAQIFNEAMAEMQEASGQRIFPMAVLPWWDLDLTLEEIERIADLGLVGVNTVADPQEYGLPDLSDPHWTPMFRALEEASLPLNFHIGASATQTSYFGTAPWPSRDNDEKLAIGSAMIYLGNARVIANFTFGGIFERHPALKLVSVESGVGWLPFFLQALDYQLLETAPDTGKALSLKPSEYFRRQCAACFWFEDSLLVENIKHLGVDNCLFETDFPHPTCLYPDPVTRAMKVFDNEDADFKRKVFGRNAVRIYNLPAPN